MRPISGLTAVVLLLAAPAPAALAQTGRVGPDLRDIGNGRKLDPEGRLSQLGNFPTGSAMTPDGRFIWAVDSGHGTDDVKVIDVATGAIVQTLPLPGGYGGVAFAADGRRAYVSGEARSTATPPPPSAGPTKGDQGDVVHVFDVDPATGKGAERDPISVAADVNGSGQTNSLPPTSKSWPEGLAVTPDGKRVVVALNQADRVAIVDVASGQATLVPVGRYPFGVAIDPDGRTAYVSDEYDGTISFVDLASASRTATVGVGGQAGDLNAHPEDMVLDAASNRLYVAVANRDHVAIVDTKGRKLVGTVSVARPEAFGAQPVGLALSPDGATLFAADEGEDALAVIDTGLAPRAVPGAAASAGTGVAVRRVVRLRTLSAILRVVRRGRSLARARGRATNACGGPTRAQEARYLRRVRSAYRRMRRAGATAAARARFRRVAGRARSALPRLRGCPAGTETGRNVVRVHSAAYVVSRLRRGVALRRLRGRAIHECGGPTRAQEARYLRAVRTAATRRRRGRLSLRRYQAALRRARARLPLVIPCPGTASRAIVTPGAAADGAARLLGRIPTAAFPTDVEVAPDNGTVTWIAAKGFGAGPNPDFVFAGAKSPSGNVETPYGGYVLDKLFGLAGTLPMPSAATLGALTRRATDHARPANTTAPPAGTPLRKGGPIKHVFYVVRENRTYDQVFGTEPRGDGDPKLELFDDNGVPGATGGITPNAHKLVKRFPLLDHFYANSEVSVDGHVITAGSVSIDYVQRATAANYSGRGRAFDFGVFPVTFGPNAFVFDQAARQGVSFRNYGEQGSGVAPTEAVSSVQQRDPSPSSEVRPQYGTVVANTENAYPGNVQIGCVAPPAGGPQCTRDSSATLPGGGPAFSAVSRLDVFAQNFRAQDAAGTVPTFNYLILPNDHTNGTTPGAPTPQAEIADNDLALGQLVDLVSHSGVWKDSAIIVVEDDSQDGADHVDAHRMPAFVVSPWASGGVVSTRYDQYSALRTAEILAGIDPLSINDALAVPMYDAFRNDGKPDTAPYDAVAPAYPLTSVNGAGAPGAALSRALPFGEMDLVPQALSDRVLWQSVHGAGSSPPPPGPNASPAEHARATGALRILRRGGDVRDYLERTGEDDDD